jgi:hypothetical protein
METGQWPFVLIQRCAALIDIACLGQKRCHPFEQTVLSGGRVRDQAQPIKD